MPILMRRRASSRCPARRRRSPKVRFRPKADVASAHFERIERCIGATLEHVGVDLAGADIHVPHELLDLADVLACLKQMGARERPCHAATADAAMRGRAHAPPLAIGRHPAPL